MEYLKRIQRHKTVPVVLSQEEVNDVLALMRGKPQLMAELIYATGVRIHECLPLRIKDVDFQSGQITVRASKGYKDRLSGRR